jgi:hypothetical protein
VSADRAQPYRQRERGNNVPKASKSSASDTVEVEGLEEHVENFEGGYTVVFGRFTADADMAASFKGLPNDQCQAPHWGYVIRGKVTYRSSSGDETFETGDAYYAPPGHTPVLYAGTELVEFSPTKELQETMAVCMKNMGG